MDELIAEIKMTVFESGVIDDSALALIKNFIVRYGVTEETARLLLDLNNVLSGTHNPNFDDFFVSTIVQFMLGTGALISDEKWLWLKNNFLKDGIIDALERNVLLKLATLAPPLPEDMQIFIKA